MKKYDHTKIEKKRQKAWQESGIYRAKEEEGTQKCYVLDMFPYPSGAGLHVGHPRGYIASDVYSRFKRMRGLNVLHPMGWDAFGLPAEQYAIKHKVHPRKAVSENVIRYKEQLSILGFDYDWEREVNTTDPAFYKWTQWIFLKLYEAGLAYQSYEPINWCPSCQTGLANEDLEDGACERCGTAIEKKPMRQWVLRITDYADRLLADLDDLAWPESVKESQRNWIGRSEGAEISFEIRGGQKAVSVFTTRPETLYGVTYLVLAPEHPLVEELKASIGNWEEAEAYRERTAQVAEIERGAAGKEKAGVRLEGLSAVNPATGEEVPVWIADYVLASYGTGAVMAVPAHDERDRAFAEKHGLPAKTVIEDGRLVDSGEFTGESAEASRKRIVEHAGGRMAVRYKLRDWVFSRQRYWGEPIPIVHCEICGTVPVPEKDLPVELPEVESYEPTGTGESPLAGIEEWVSTDCPKCGGKARRETNTMPQWAGSSWYYLRYMDPRNDEALVGKDKEAYWSPVDIYVGGTEHATRHLIYARFWHKFLFDLGAVSTKEPFARLQNQGLIMGADGRKMSKRWGNVVNPDGIVSAYGADTLRVYEMFMGPFSLAVNWNTESIMGARRFIERVWRLHGKAEEGLSPDADLERVLHKTVKKVSEDIEEMNFNTAISAMMILAGEMEKREKVSKESFAAFLQILAPFAPHVADELWEMLGREGSVHVSSWPAYDPEKLKEDSVTVAVQVNGKVRAEISVPAGIGREELEAAALAEPRLAPWLEGKEVKRIVVVPGRLVNVVAA